MASFERYGGGRIVICEYDPSWPAQFEQERVLLHEALAPMVIAIEHVGSTAVPGLAAKPIIDLLASVRSLAEARSRCVQPLEALGYTYLPENESWLPEEMMFRKGVPGPWTHHVHVMEPSSPRWDELILIRDYLRRHLETATAYADLKKLLADRFEDDIAGYRAAKGSFLQSLIAAARAEEGSDRHNM
jgi:GrpB-like predicted nucleotidyltransferase (UPF0157 family)